MVFALLVLPPAATQLLSARPVVSLTVSVLIGLSTVWVSLSAAYYTPYPVGFWLATVGFAAYLAARVGTGATTALRGPRLPDPALA